jgi:hypothetical protein
MNMKFNLQITKMGFLLFVTLLVTGCDLSSEALVGKKAVRPKDDYYEYPSNYCDRNLELKGEASCFTEELDDVVSEISHLSSSDFVKVPEASAATERFHGGFSIAIKLRDSHRALELGDVIYQKGSGGAFEFRLQCAQNTSYPEGIGYRVYDCGLIAPQKPSGTYRLKSIEFKVDGCVQKYQTPPDNTSKCSSYNYTVEVGFESAPAISIGY